MDVLYGWPLYRQGREVTCIFGHSFSSRAAMQLKFLRHYAIDRGSCQFVSTTSNTSGAGRKAIVRRSRDGAVIHKGIYDLRRRSEVGRAVGLAPLDAPARLHATDRGVDGIWRSHRRRNLPTEKRVGRGQEEDRIRRDRTPTTKVTRRLELRRSKVFATRRPHFPLTAMG